jgi:hypothetical protein
MPKFTLDNNGRKKVESIALNNGGGNKRLYLADAKVNNVSEITLRSGNNAIATAKIYKTPFNGPKGIWTIDLTPRKNGKVDIKATVKGTTATLKISIADGVVLPSASSDDGLLARLFLAESRSPDEAGYNSGDSKKGMQWMKLVVHNRLNNNPSQFAAPGAKSIADIVKAKGQFKGFEKYPAIDITILSRINKIISLANSNNDSRQAKYKHFVVNAIDVAKHNVIKDPSPKGLYGWRTDGSGSPGGRFVKYGNPLSGNQFYTLQ